MRGPERGRLRPRFCRQVARPHSRRQHEPKFADGVSAPLLDMALATEGTTPWKLD